jgi:hypothetical protein
MDKTDKSEGGQPSVSTGEIVRVGGLGCYIQPDTDEHAVVGFPGIEPDELPDGFNVGDRIEFRMDTDRSGNAKEYGKIELEENLPK